MYYMGSKYRLLKYITPLMPNGIKTFHDVFGGSGVVSLNVNAEGINYNESNYEIYSLFRVLMDNDKDCILNHYIDRTKQFDLAPGLGGKGKTKYKGLSEKDFNELSEYRKSQYCLFRDFVNKTSENEMRYLDLFTLSCYSHCHNLRFNKSGKMNMPLGNDGSVEATEAKLKDHAPSDKIKYYNLDFIDFFETIEFDKDDFVYCDPPYTNTTAVYNEGNLLGGGWTVENDKMLFKILDNLNAQGINWGLSNVFVNKGKENTHLIEWCENKGYNVHFIKHKYSALGKGNSNNVEVYITNIKQEDK